MEVRSTVIIKDIEALTAGELFYFELERARALGLLIRKVEDQPLIVGVLHMDATPEVAPFLITYSDDIPCVSLGKDWVLEAEPDADTWPGNSSLEDRGGAVHFLADGVALRFGRDAQNPRLSGMSVDLKTMQPARLRAYGFASTLHWKIWAGKDSPRYPGERPIFEFAGLP